MTCFSHHAQVREEIMRPFMLEAYTNHRAAVGPSRLALDAHGFALLWPSTLSVRTFIQHLKSQEVASDHEEFGSGYLDTVRPCLSALAKNLSSEPSIHVRLMKQGCFQSAVTLATHARMMQKFSAKSVLHWVLPENNSAQFLADGMLKLLRDFHESLNKMEPNIALVEEVKERLCGMSDAELQVANLWIPLLTHMRQLFQDSRGLVSALGQAASKKITRALVMEQCKIAEVYPADYMDWMLPSERDRKKLGQWLDGKANHERHKTIRPAAQKLEKLATAARAMNFAPFELDPPIQEVLELSRDAFKHH